MCDAQEVRQGDVMVSNPSQPVQSFNVAGWDQLRCEAVTPSVFSWD